MNLLSSYRTRKSETDYRRKNGDLKFDPRMPIESDYGRLVFSTAFRRLHDKTQVFPLTSNDNTHSRLTHSLEVASVGKSFALNIFKDEDMCKAFGSDANNPRLWKTLTTLIEVVYLAHDIGNPPLGHFGETAIKCFFTRLFDEMKEDLDKYREIKDLKSISHPIILSELSRYADQENKHKAITSIEEFLTTSNLRLDYTEFDGNAEGFRVLTKLQFLNDLHGLNLTSASLASFLKYPNTGESKKSNNKDEDQLSQHKHGVFETEKTVMQKVMDACDITRIDDNSYHRHPISYIMEASDTICYLLMDLEDAISKGWLGYNDVRTLLMQSKKGKDIIYMAEGHFDANAPEKKKIVQLRSELMSYLVKLAFDNFKAHFTEICDGKYNEELVFDDRELIAKTLQKYSVSHVYSHREIENLELTGEAVITGLLDYYIRYLFHPQKEYRFHCKHIISKTIFMTTLQEHLDYNNAGTKAWNEYEDFDPKDLGFEEKLRIIRDHVSSMTDKYAVDQYRKLSGQKI